MFNKERILELTKMGLIRENVNNLEEYILIKDTNIETEFCSFEICLWSNGNISFTDILNFQDCNGYCIGNKITGKGSKIYRADIKKSIKMFNIKYQDVLNKISA